jgi:hypothetical protein
LMPSRRITPGPARQLKRTRHSFDGEHGDVRGENADRTAVSCFERSQDVNLSHCIGGCALATSVRSIP